MLHRMYCIAPAPTTRGGRQSTTTPHPSRNGKGRSGKREPTLRSSASAIRIEAQCNAFPGFCRRIGAPCGSSPWNVAYFVFGFAYPGSEKRQLRISPIHCGEIRGSASRNPRKALHRTSQRGIRTVRQDRRVTPCSARSPSLAPRAKASASPRSPQPPHDSRV